MWGGILINGRGCGVFGAARYEPTQTPHNPDPTVKMKFSYTTKITYIEIGINIFFILTVHLLLRHFSVANFFDVEIEL